VSGIVSAKMDDSVPATFLRFPFCVFHLSAFTRFSEGCIIFRVLPDHATKFLDSG